MSSPSPPTYSTRHRLLSHVLEQNSSSTGPSRFSVPPHLVTSEDARSSTLDTILFRGWGAASGTAEQKLFQHVEALRINHEDFQTIGRLGDGQFGVVDAVESKLDGQVYAMKTMQKYAISRAGPQLSLPVERHIHILSYSSTISPIPKLLAAFQSQTTISLVTTYAECGSLWDRLCYLSEEDDQAGCMTDTEIQWWAPQMAVAIQWLHDQGYVHRDIKPHNFLITAEKRLLLTDFGSAASLHRSRSSGVPFVARDDCCLPVGTPDYIAPEVLQFAEAAILEAESGQYTTRTAAGYGSNIDWWSYGASLYEMASGKGPFWAPTIQQTYILLTQYKGHLQHTLPMNEDLSELVQSLLKLSESRPSHMRSLVASPFFRDILWDRLDQGTCHSYASYADIIAIPPSTLDHLEPIDLNSLHPGTEDATKVTDFTFDHLFNQSDVSDRSITNTENLASPDISNPAAARWIGWTWEPPPSLLRPHTSNSKRLVPRHNVIRPSSDYATPVRPRSHLAVSTARRTVPGSRVRSRPMSERQAFVELVQCVEKSAKKQLSRDKNRSWLINRSAPVRAIPPTPTPLSRDASKLGDHLNKSSRNSRIRDRSSSACRTPTISELEKQHLSLMSRLNNFDHRLHNLRQMVADSSDN